MGKKDKIKLVITDLDNTLYDWVSSFVPAFYAMVHIGSDLLGISEQELLDELQTVHQHHGNSEHPFALLETKTAREQYGDSQVEKAKSALDPAFYEFNRVRKQTLRVYDTVKETLAELDAMGVDVVAHTDARIHNAMFRLIKLELVGGIKALYAPSHTASDTPPENDADEYNEFPGFVRVLPPHDRKPNPQVIEDICEEYSVAPEKALYVGDSLSRDVFMAKNAGAVSAWARYGTRFDKKLWDQLVRVTHWTNDDVEADNKLRELSRGTTPDFSIDEFGQILQVCTFEPTSS